MPSRSKRRIAAEDLYRTYICSGQKLLNWVAPAPLNKDFSLKLEYVAGLALNQNVKDQIITDIRHHCVY